MSKTKLPKLELTKLDLKVCKFDFDAEVPKSVLQSDFFSVTKTADELSVVCPMNVKLKCKNIERDWKCFRVKGQLDFSLTGILSKIAQPLAKNQISLFAVSTFNTDYVLVKKEKFKKAIEVLRKVGFIFSTVLFTQNIFASSTGTMHTVPVIEANGELKQIQMRVCLPTYKEKSRVVVLNHGSPKVEDRPKVKGYMCESEPARWFLERGYLVASPIRRGYGITGGEWTENYGPCKNPDFIRGGLETARDIDAAVEYVRTLPEAEPEGMVIVGQSAGGWGTIAHNSIKHSHVSAMINMAGGRGGHQNGLANNNCSPERLTKTAGYFGKTASTPMLWIYTDNDGFFGPELAISLFTAFSNGGGNAHFHPIEAFGNEGHNLFAGKNGSEIWGPLVEDYLTK